MFVRHWSNKSEYIVSNTYGTKPWVRLCTIVGNTRWVGWKSHRLNCKLKGFLCLTQMRKKCPRIQLCLFWLIGNGERGEVDRIRFDLIKRERKMWKCGWQSSSSPQAGAAYEQRSRVYSAALPSYCAMAVQYYYGIAYRYGSALLLWLCILLW